MLAAVSSLMEPPEILEEELLEEPASSPLPLEEPGFLGRFLRDYSLLALLILTLVVNLALFGFLLLRYDALQDPLPLHFSAAGFPDLIGAKSGVFMLPAIGLVVFGLNVALGVIAYRLERAASLLLGAGALFVQFLMWLAAINIAGGL